VGCDKQVCGERGQLKRLTSDWGRQTSRTAVGAKMHGSKFYSNFLSFVPEESHRGRNSYTATTQQFMDGDVMTLRVCGSKCVGLIR
jgi:hypothetical protein